jgi:hypothetical protein
MEEKRKSRSIPIQEYISILQLEYLSYLVRSNLFEEPFASKYKEFCDKKESTIKSFALKEGRPCIFNNDHIKQKYIEEFFGESGLPNFKYRDEYQKENIGFYDKKYFFKEGVVVIYEGEEWVIDRNMCYRDNSCNLISIKQKGKPWKKVDISEVTRKDYLLLI